MTCITSFLKFICTMAGYAGGESTSHNVISRPFPEGYTSLQLSYVEDGKVRTSESFQNACYNDTGSIIHRQVPPSGVYVGEVQHLA